MGLSSTENEGVSPMEKVRGNFDFKKWFSHVSISFCHMSVFYHMLGHERQIIQNRLRNEIFCQVSTFYVATSSRDKSFI